MIAFRNLRHELSDRRAAWTLCALFLLGLAIRLVFLNRAGTSDIDIDLQWGKDANTLGLPISYHGNYFPFQYQIFQIAAASGYPVSSLVVFKTINLIADVGVFVLLILLLRRWGLNVFYACLYWLHPYFLAMFWLGYVDVQFVFFIVLGLLALTRAVGVRDYLIAGVPFGLAWLMKPQPLIGAVMIIVFGTVLLFEAKLASKRESVPRVLRLSTLFAASAVLWLAYAAWFALETHDAKRFLSSTYHGTVGFMPVLTAQMLNIWHPVAVYYRTGAEPIWAVRGPESLHILGQAITAILLVGAAVAVSRLAKLQKDDIAVLLLFGLGAAILPMTMTRAHENHFFLAASLLVPICAFLRSSLLTMVAVAFLAVQFINLFGLYLFGSNNLSTSPAVVRFQDWYSSDVRMVLAFASVGLFVALIGLILTGLASDQERREVRDRRTRRSDATA